MIDWIILQTARVHTRETFFENASTFLKLIFTDEKYFLAISSFSVVCKKEDHKNIGKILVQE